MFLLCVFEFDGDFVAPFDTNSLIDFAKGASADFADDFELVGNNYFHESVGVT